MAINSEIATAQRMQVDAVGTTLDVMDRIAKLPEWEQASVMTEFFGDEARALAPLLSQLDTLRATLGYVADDTAYAGSVNREFENRSKTTANALQLFKNRANELGITIGSILLPAINDVLAAAGPAMLRVAQWADAHPALTRAIIMTGAALVALRVAALAAQFSFLWMKGGVISAAILGLRGLGAAGRFAAAGFVAHTAVTSARALLGQRQAAYRAALAMQALARSGSVVGLSFAQATANVVSAGRALVQAQTGMRAANAALLSVGVAGRAIAFLPAMLAPIGTVIGGIAAAIAAVTAPVWIVIGVVGAAVAGLALAIYNYWVPISEFVIGFAAVIGGAISEIVSVVTGLGGRVASAVGSWATQKLIDFSAWLGIDEATVQQSLGRAITVMAAPINAIVTMFRDIPSRIGNWLSDVFTINSYSEADVAGFRQAGERMARALVEAIGSGLAGAARLPLNLVAAVQDLVPRMATVGGNIAQAMWDGVRAKIDAMVAWFSGLPGRIVEAIGSIDLGSLIEWPSPPAWLTRLWGGEDKASVAVSAATRAANDNAPPTTLEEASPVAHAATTAVTLPEPTTEGWGEAARRGLADFIRSLSSEGGQAGAEAKRIGTTVEDAMSVTAHPKVETSALERAIALATSLREKLLGLPSVSVNTKASLAVAGARARGGAVRADDTYLVGEEGPELVTFGRNAFVHNAITSAKMLRTAALAATTIAMPVAAMPQLAMPDLTQRIAGLEIGVPQMPALDLALPRLPALDMMVPEFPQLSVAMPDLTQRMAGLEMGVPQMPALDLALPRLSALDMMVSEFPQLSVAMPDLTQRMAGLEMGVPQMPALDLALPRLPALDMMVPEFPQLSVAMPDLTQRMAGLEFGVRQLPALDLMMPQLPQLSLAMPELPLPTVPQVEWPEERESNPGGRRREGGSTDIRFENGSIVVNAAPGQSPEDIAKAVEARLTARLGALSRGSFSDGAT